MTSKTPFLSVGLARIVDPSLERIHKIGEMGKAMIDIDSTRSLDEVEDRFKAALEWIRQQRKREC